jgi:hypothetical protein
MLHLKDGEGLVPATATASKQTPSPGLLEPNREMDLNDVTLRYSMREQFLIFNIQVFMLFQLLRIIIYFIIIYQIGSIANLSHASTLAKQPIYNQVLLVLSLL